MKIFFFIKGQIPKGGMTSNSLVIINKFCVIRIQGIPLVFVDGAIHCKLVFGLLL
jgi:hypothetical protein